jgi:hypothetical protein
MNTITSLAQHEVADAIHFGILRLLAMVRQHKTEGAVRHQNGEPGFRLLQPGWVYKPQHYRKLLNFQPMKDKSKPMKEDFFHQLYLIFHRSLTDGSY